MRLLLSLSLFITVFLSGCGFSLRGTGESLPELFAKVYYQTSTPVNESFDSRVKHLIVLSGGKLVTRDAATVIVQAGAIGEQSRQIAVAGNGALKEYERTYTTTVTVSDAKTQAQLGSRDISVTKNVQLDERRALAGEEQAEIVKNSAERALSQAVISYLKTF